MTDIPSFSDFYRAVHRRAPFPWQDRLAARVIDEGWPDEISVPTGLGKTACIDIALWAMATEADLPPMERRQPRRIWYVVNRRLLVDAATSLGNDLAGLLNDGTGAADPGAQKVVRDIGLALRKLGSVEAGDGLPSGHAGRAFHCARLRGGADLGQRPPDPAMPSLILATVPMFASRWLLRGYGSSGLMRSVDAALAGTDSLVLLDEAHLAPALLRISDPLAACDPGRASVPLPPERRSPTLVGLTATGQTVGDRFDLDDEDRAIELVQERLHAPKPTTVVMTDKAHLAAELASQADVVLSERPGETCLVFANDPRTARDVFTRLSNSRPDGEVLLLTGQVREPDAGKLRKAVLDPANGLVSGSQRSGGTLRCVVATQTLEVGADLDADHLVTQSAGRRALVQRFGRLNRLGKKTHPSAVVCHPTDVTDDPLYGSEPAEIAALLDDLDRADLCAASISQVLGAPADEHHFTAELLPALVWEWAKTSLAPVGEAPVESYFAPPDDDIARVSVAWRAHVPAEDHRMRPAVRSEETVEIGLGAFRSLVKSARGAEPWKGTRLASDRLRVESVGEEDLRPGDVVIMCHDWGHYDQHGWAVQRGGAEVEDLSIATSRFLSLDSETLRYLFATGHQTLGSKVGSLRRALAVAAGTADPPDDGSIEPQEASDELLRELLSADIQPSELGSAAWLGSGDDPGIRSRLPPLGQPSWLVDGCELYLQLELVDRSSALRGDDGDDLSFLSQSARLDAHLRSVGDMAERIARAIGLEPPLVSAVREAGRLHDLGKYDERFQRRLGREPGSEPLAKSGARRTDSDPRRNGGWPRRGRHEVLSARLVAAWLDGSSERLADLDRELVVHLVISHHGHGRPSLPVADDPVSGIVGCEVDGTVVAVDSTLALADWAQPHRFRRLCERYGYWGLALLEAVVRQADHRASAWIEAERSVDAPLYVEVV